MSPKLAHRRYIKIFIPAMIFYLLSVFAVAFIKNRQILPDWGLMLAALVPGICVCVFLWAQARWIRETDEYLRTVQINGMGLALMLTMGITTVWGLIELYVDVPKLPIFYVLPLFYGLHGVITCVMCKFRRTSNGIGPETSS